MSTLGLALLAGILTTLSPCVLPLLPLLASGVVARHPLAPLAMVAGLVSSFALVGGSLAAVGIMAGLSAEVIRTTALLLLLVAGLFLLFKRLNTWLATRLAGFASRTSTATRGWVRFGLLGEFLVGATLGLVWSPCSGPTLGSVLGLAAADGLGLHTVVPLAVFGIGASLPLLMFAYGARAALTRRHTLRAFTRVAKPALGTLLVLLALAGLTGADHRIESFLLDHAPHALTSWSVRL